MANVAQGQFQTSVFVRGNDKIGIALRNMQAIQHTPGFDRERRQTYSKTAEQRRQDVLGIASAARGRRRSADAGNGRTREAEDRAGENAGAAVDFVGGAAARDIAIVAADVASVVCG